MVPAFIAPFFYATVVSFNTDMVYYIYQLDGQPLYVYLNRLLEKSSWLQRVWDFFIQLDDPSMFKKKKS